MPCAGQRQHTAGPGSGCGTQNHEDNRRAAKSISGLNTDLSDHGIVKAYSGDAVINSDWVSAGTVVYKVLNGTCFVDFDITVKEITAINTLIVSGLPESTIVRHGRITGWENGDISMPFYLNKKDIIANPCGAGRYAGCLSFSII